MSDEKPKGEIVDIPEEEEVSPESTWKRETFKGNKPPKVTGQKPPKKK